MAKEIFIKTHFQFLMAILLWIIMVVGFSSVLILDGGVPDYYDTRLISHGIINFLWFTLLVFQSSLIRSNKQNLHIAIGKIGIIFFIVVALNILYIFYTTYTRRGHFIAVDWMVLFQFILGLFLILKGFQQRKYNHQLHKDYILFGSFCLIQPAINRFAAIFGQYYIVGFILTSLVIVTLFILHWKKIKWPVIAWLIAWGAGVYLRFIH